MSESEQTAAEAMRESHHIDEEDRLRPEFVDRVLDAVEAGDDETARRLVGDGRREVLHHLAVVGDGRAVRALGYPARNHKPVQP